MPRVRPGPGLHQMPQPSRLLLTPGVQSGIERLAEMPMLINGMLPTTSLVFVGGDASAEGWAERGGAGTLALQAGTAPSFEQPSPLSPADEYGVLFNTGGYFAGDNALGNFGTNDLLVELFLFPKATSRQILSHYLAAVSGLYIMGPWGWSNLALSLHYPSTSVLVESANLISGGMTNQWLHAMVAINRDEASTNGAKWYIDGAVSGSGADVSAAAATAMDSNSPFIIGARADGGNSFDSGLAYLAVHSRANWFQAGAAGPAEWATIAKNRFAALMGSKPKRSRYSILAPISSGTTVAAHQPKRLADGYTQLFLMGPSTPRFEVGQDANGVDYVGALIEGAIINQLRYSISRSDWTKAGAVAVTPNTVETPDPLGYYGADKLTGLGAEGVSDIYRTTSGFGVSVSLAVGIWIKRISTAGVVTIKNSSGSAYGLWTLNLASLPDRWERITPIHPAVTVTTAFTSTSVGAGGILLFTTGGSPLSFYMWNAQAQPNTTILDSDVICPSSSAVTKPADVLKYTITEGQEIGVGKGSMYVKFVAPDLASLDSTKTLVNLSIGSATDDRIMLYVDASRHVTGHVFVGGSTAGRCSSSTDVVDGIIHEALLCWDCAGLHLCVDGVWNGVATTIPTGLTRATIGSSPVPSFHAGPVRIIDARLWPRVITWPGRLR